MCGLVEDRAHGGKFDDFPGIHNRHVVAHLGYNTNVVGDEDHG
jgi:hypothetical protein